jgi:hypothetical protein
MSLVLLATTVSLWLRDPNFDFDLESLAYVAALKAMLEEEQRRFLGIDELVVATKGSSTFTLDSNVGTPCLPPSRSGGRCSGDSFITPLPQKAKDAEVSSAHPRVSMSAGNKASSVLEFTGLPAGL